MGEISYCSPLTKAPPNAKPAKWPTVLGYCYASDDISLERQALDVLDYCERHNLRITKFHVDRRVVGVTNEQPAWQQLVGEVGIGTIVVVANASRLSRDMTTLQKMLKEVLSEGVAFRSSERSFADDPLAGLLRTGRSGGRARRIRP